MVYVIIFLGSVVLANLAVQYFGPASTPIVAFILIGLDLSLRDKIHEVWHGNKLALKMLALIASAGVVTYLLNRDAGQIAIASTVAFMGAMLVDGLVYEKYFTKERIFKMNASNLVSAAADTVLFIWIAFGVFMWKIMIIQYVAKVVGGLLWSYILTYKDRGHDYISREH